ncbi:hypothetical protein PBI_ELVA_30 [Microbacterium phage Elva]|uniref:hypothetical protein n=1 Tax=Microbacterium phage Elva TaxID=2126929 RepID=UPI000D1FDC30|nr:hypothetical protein QDW20_gp30 [Microbacterium phage Elva]AVR56771.1 hypothetical protein PBI_ELVA_30 [Microbacterium phage Elva]
MNKYASRGLAFAAIVEARTVLVVTRHAEVQIALREMAEIGVQGQVVRRANGAEEIRYPNGGRVLFRAAGGHGYRGVSVDTVYLDAGLGNDDRLLDDLVPCVQASPRGELVRA